MDNDIKQLIKQIKNLGKPINENVNEKIMKTQIFLDVDKQFGSRHFYIINDNESVEVIFFINDEKPLIKSWDYKITVEGNLVFEL
jgi:hypothetical protein